MAIYFTIKEMTESSTARACQIDNWPKEKYIKENLKKVMYILDLTRVYIGKPIHINSGYRCKKLNEMVGGVSNSMHTKGLAADFRTAFEPDIETMYNYLNIRKEKFQITELIKYERFIHMAVSQSLTI
mgnify:CR=1 FL=1